MHENLARQLHLHGDLQHEPEYFGRAMSKPTHALIGTQEDFNAAVVGLFDALVREALDIGAKATLDPDAESGFRESYGAMKLDSLAALRVDSIGNELIFY